MKTTIVNYEKKETIDFPLIAKNVEHGFIVLFMQERSGMYLTNSKNQKACDVSEHFISCFDVSTWEILDEITINFKSK